MCALVTGVQTCALPISSNLSRWPLAALWLGRSAELLQNGCMAWPPGPEVGMIAGSLPHGLGGLLARFEGDNDGTVLVEETRSPQLRSEEHTSELQSLMRISYAVFCLKKKNTGKDKRDDRADIKHK